MGEKKKVLFLCTGNSCRSQMAEAIVNNQAGRQWEAYSAGTHPAGGIHPKALRVLDEIGIHHSGRPKHVGELSSLPFDLVVTVCDSAAEECPPWLGPGKRLHVSFPDPAKAEGSEDQTLQAFRQVRDDIRRKIPVLLKQQQVAP